MSAIERPALVWLHCADRSADGKRAEKERLGRTVALVPSARHGGSVFGGPLELGLVEREPRPLLHQVVALGHDALAALALPGQVGCIPLVFGLSHSGCELEYRYDEDELELITLEPAEPSADWPYANYPRLLPYVPLEVGSLERESWASFAQRAPCPPSAPSEDLVALLPPPAGLGCSLWGRMGDAEGVTLVFACAWRERRVRAYTLCG